VLWNSVRRTGTRIRLRTDIQFCVPLWRDSLSVPDLSNSAAPRAPQPQSLDTVLKGVAYYPEYMPSDRLEKDVALMQKAGINVVRLGEFTWSSWEPRDGEFEFAWMERVIDRLHQAGSQSDSRPSRGISTWSPPPARSEEGRRGRDPGEYRLGERAELDAGQQGAGTASRRSGLSITRNSPASPNP
jgi:Beta-galactosidase